MRAVPFLIASFVQDYLHVDPPSPRIGKRPQNRFGGKFIGLHANAVSRRDNGRDDSALAGMTGDETYSDFRRNGRLFRPRRPSDAEQAQSQQER